MAEDRSREQDRVSENWLKNWEDQCLEDLQTETNMEENLHVEQQQSAQKLWLSFQNSASAVAQLYKDRHQGMALWLPFQNAAETVTVLYKDGLDVQKRSLEIGIQCGHQRRTKDILAWAKKRRRHIRREDLIAYLCGKSPPVRPRASPTHGRPTPRLSLDRSSPRLPTPDIQEPDPDLHMFREALALQGLNGAMSNVSVEYKHSPQTGRTHGIEELNGFIIDELTRHNEARKRTANTDVIMDSPTRKRSRLYFE